MKRNRPGKGSYTVKKRRAVNLSLMFHAEEKENCAELMTVHGREMFMRGGCGNEKEEYFTVQI